MNLYKKDYRNLYLLQDRFLLHWNTLNMPFYLTGGTALGRFYLNHRYSEDLDFFVNNNRDFSRLMLVFKNSLNNKFRTDIPKTLITDDFARFFIEIDDSILKIEFVNDVAYRIGSPLRMGNLLVDTASNILANKLTAIISRDEPKDIFDIVALSLNYSFNWTEIFNHSKEKSLINEIDVARRLNSFPVQMLANIDWLINPPDPKSFEHHLKQISDDFILGRDNSLGLNKINIENATIKR